MLDPDTPGLRRSGHRRPAGHDVSAAVHEEVRSAGLDEHESGLLDCPALHDAGGVGQAIRPVFACIEVPIREPGELVAQAHDPPDVRARVVDGELAAHDAAHFTVGLVRREAAVYVVEVVDCYIERPRRHIWIADVERDDRAHDMLDPG